MVRQRLLHAIVGAIVLTAVVLPLGVLGFIKSGIYDVGASRPHTKLTEWMTHETMIHSVRSHAKGIEAPTSVSVADIRSGFCAYETHCVACHGGPAVARERWVSGVEPSPPYLLDATQRWKPRELFWIAKNGIKMTGMPAWRNVMSDREIWDVVAFLEAMSKMNPDVYARLRDQRICSAGPNAALVSSDSMLQGR